MKLYIHKVAVFSRPITLFAAENKLDAEIIDVDVFGGECKEEAFAKLNRSKQIPVLEDDGFYLTECSAILKYLADKIDSPDYPKDLKKRARVNEAMDWFNTGFYREFGYHLIYPQLLPNHKRQTDEVNRATVEWGRENRGSGSTSSTATGWAAAIDTCAATRSPSPTISAPAR